MDILTVNRRSGEQSSLRRDKMPVGHEKAETTNKDDASDEGITADYPQGIGLAFVVIALVLSMFLVSYSSTRTSRIPC